MSIADVTGPLSPKQARELVRAIWATGQVFFSKHAEDELRKDGMDRGDAVNVLRGGTIFEDGLKNGSWRYRVETMKFCVVIAFRSETRLVVVTAWRKQ